MHFHPAKLLLLLALLAPSAASQTLFMVHEGVGTGTLAGLPFAAAPFTITCTGDIANVQGGSSSAFSLDHTTATIEIAGVGTFDFLSSTQTFVNQQTSLVGFSIAAFLGPDLYQGPTDSALTSWDLTTPIGPLTGTGRLLQWSFTNVSTSGGQLIFDNELDVPCTFTASFGLPGALGSNYCTAELNSTGVAGVMSANGLLEAASNNVTLTASALPTGQFGLFLTSQTQAFVPGSNGSSNGNLCLGGAIGRFLGAGQVLSSGPAGAISIPIDLTAIPQGAGSVTVMAGQSWNYQAWFRDATGLGSNFTDGLEITFQ